MFLLKFLNLILAGFDHLFFPRSVVLTYHSISDGETPISVKTDDFRKQMKFLKESGANVLSAGDFLSFKRGVLVTFDDGFKDVATNALPILLKHNLSAVVFVNPSTLGGKAEFATLAQDRAREICSLSDLSKLSDNGVVIGNHGYSHRQLSNLSEAEVASEYEKANVFIKENFRANGFPDVFVFPRGAKNEQIKEMLRSKGAKVLDDRIDVYSDTSLFGFVLRISPSYLWLRKKLIAIKKHWLAFVLAAIVGLLVVLPTLLVVSKIGPDFKGVYPMFSNDEDQYLAMTREAYDGRYNFGSVYLKEHKNAPSLMQPLAEIIFANIAATLGISVPQLFAINDFLLPFAGVVLLYFLILALTESMTISGGFSFLYYLLFISQFNRPINPQFSFLFLFAGLFLIWKVINNKKEDLRGLLFLNSLLAVDFGIVFYIYPFVWSAIFVSYCLVLFALMVLEREILYYLKSFLFFAIPSAVFSVPFVLSLRNAVADPNYADANLRFGFIFNHLPAAYVNVALMVLGLTIIYLAGRDVNYRRAIFSLALVLTGVILNWQNVITGKAFSFSMHYYWVVVLFLIIVFAICVTKRRVLATILVVVSMAGLFYKERYGVWSGLSELTRSASVSEFRDTQELAGVAGWFDKNSLPDSSVMSLGGNHHWFITSYTSNNDFQNANAGVYLISDDELENRWVIQNFFNNDIDADYIVRHNVEIWTNKFIEMYQSKSNRNKTISFFTGRPGLEVELIPKEYVDRVLAKTSSYKKLGFEKALEEYSVDYILLDKDDLQYGQLRDKFKKMSFLSLAAELDNNLIFKVK